VILGDFEEGGRRIRELLGRPGLLSADIIRRDPRLRNVQLGTR